MDRRTFLIRLGGLTVAVSAVGVLEACGGDDESPTSTGDGGNCPAGVASGGDITFTNTDPGHKHEASLAESDIDSPPPGGRVITVTLASGHDHTVTVTQSDFQSIQDGNKVTKTSSTNSGHSHVYCLWRV
jgi:hypothetical protein